MRWKWTLNPTLTKNQIFDAFKWGSRSRIKEDRKHIDEVNNKIRGLTIPDNLKGRRSPHLHKGLEFAKLKGELKGEIPTRQKTLEYGHPIPKPKKSSSPDSPSAVIVRFFSRIYLHPTLKFTFPVLKPKEFWPDYAKRLKQHRRNHQGLGKNTGKIKYTTKTLT